MYQYDKPVKTYSNSEKNRAASAKISTHTAQTEKISPLNIIRPNQPNIFQKISDNRNKPIEQGTSESHVKNTVTNMPVTPNRGTFSNCPLPLNGIAAPCIQRKEIGVVIEMIAPAEPGYESNRTLIDQITAKHNSLDKTLQNKLFYAIGFNGREGTATGYADGDVEADISSARTDKERIEKEEWGRQDIEDAQKEININKRIGNQIAKISSKRSKQNKGAPKQTYNKLNQESYGYIPKYLRWGFDKWTWPALDSICYKNYLKNKIGFSERQMRMNFPFRAWREFAHKVAKDHWGANEWVKEGTLEPRELVYRTADSDQAWKPEELAPEIDMVKTELSKNPSEVSSGSGESSSLRKLEREDLHKPLVLTTPYNWSKGTPEIEPIENEAYSYNTYLSELNNLEIQKRQQLYNENPLYIYYPEPTTFFTKKAADIHPAEPCGVLEGAAKISAIVKEICAVNDGTIPEAAALKRMFIFLHQVPLTSDPGLRANSLVNLYNNVSRIPNPSTRTETLKEGMKKIDQSAFEDNYKDSAYKWNTSIS